MQHRQACARSARFSSGKRMPKANQSTCPELLTVEGKVLLNKSRDGCDGGDTYRQG